MVGYFSLRKCARKRASSVLVPLASINAKKVTYELMVIGRL
jgi:hypothetical protein